MNSTIRLATPDDAEAVLEIYAPIVLHTPISFEVEPPTLEEMRRRISATLERFPWLVVAQGSEILGYAYAGRHRERAAYRWSVEPTVYVGEGWRGCGVGKALYTSLFAVLRLQGFCHAYAGITLPNPASVALHEATGFTPVGVFQSIGHKFGQWHDTSWWQLALREPSPNPAEPLPLPQALTLADWDAALALGLSSLLTNP